MKLNRAVSHLLESYWPKMVASHFSLVLLILLVTNAFAESNQISENEDSEISLQKGFSNSYILDKRSTCPSSLAEVLLLRSEENEFMESEILPSDSQIRLLCQIISTSIDQIRTLLSEKIRNKINLLIVPRSYFLILEAPSWANALTVDGRIFLSNDLELNEETRKAIHHEVMHAYIYEIAKDKVPAWIEEGLSQMVSGQELIIESKSLSSWKRPHLKDLQKDFHYLSLEDAELAYSISHKAVKRLVKDQGFKSFGDYLREISNGKNHEEAFFNAFNKSESELDSILFK